MFDGSSSLAGPIIHYLDCELRFPSSTCLSPARLYVTSLSGADIILGSKWLTDNYATFDFKSSTVQVSLPLPADTPTATASPIATARAPPIVKVQPIATVPVPTAPKVPKVKIDRSLPPTLLSPPVPVIRYSLSRHRLRHSKPNSIPLRSPRSWGFPSKALVADQLVDLCLNQAVLRATTTTSAKDLQDLSIEDKLKLLVPHQYHDFLDLFDPKEGTTSLPPHREYDMRIELVPNHKLEPAKLYTLGGNEKEALIDTIEKELASGRIRPSNAAYGSPMFFVPKKDGQYRMVVDYRHLNSQTVADVYPLPLIPQLLEDMKDAIYFTKLDLVGAYQLLRVAAGFEHLTAFRTQYGMFESLVVRDGLRNAPAVFQHFLNDVFRTLLGRGVAVYIDDIIIYAPTLEELRLVTSKVLALVRSAKLFLKADKCEFEKTEVDFLGYKMSKAGVSTDPKKIDAVRSFPVPRTLGESRSFIGLVSYYRRFVPSFSKIASPITSLTRKDTPFDWGVKQQQAFEELKARLISAPIIAHFDVSRETLLQTDASAFGWGFIVSQIDPKTRLEHPVFIESGKFVGSELNYTVAEKEYLAIVEAFRRCRHLLLQVHTTVATDHQNLTWWMKARQLNPRQARWTTELAPYDFTIVYRPGRQAMMPDALSRRSDYHPGKGATSSLPDNFVQALPNFNKRSEPRVEFLRALQTSILQGREYWVDDKDILKGQEESEEIREVRKEMMGLVRFGEERREERGEARKEETELKSVQDLRRRTRNPGYLRPHWTKQGFLAFGDRVYLPDINDSHLKILVARHASPLAGHPGVSKTRELVERDYIWTGLRQHAEEFVNGCSVCQTAKPVHHKPYGLLKTLEVPSRPWEHISMDFVEPLPIANGFDSILVVIDRHSKWGTFIPTRTDITAANLADILFDRVFALHGLPLSIVSDRGSKFVSKFWTYLNKRLDVRLRLSTAYHPQTDGQTERTNQVMETYLRIYCSHNQDDWSALLPQAAFAYNNSVHSAIKATPFFINHGFHPRWVNEIKSTTTTVTEVPSASNVIACLEDVFVECSQHIAFANEFYSKYANSDRMSPPVFEPGSKVMLSMRNIKTRRPSRKLDVKYSGPFEVKERIGTLNYRLKLPPSVKIHDVFHVSLLEPFHEPSFPGQQPIRPGPLQVDEEEVYEVARIVDSRLYGRRKELQYLVEWLGYENTPEATTWEPRRHIRTQQLKDEFHLANPDKPGP